MQRTPPGTYAEVATAGERFRAFVPAPLPPDPLIVWSPTLRRRFDDALVALGRLDALSAVHQAPQRQPITTSAALVKATELSAATVNKSLVHLECLGVVAELTNRQRGRVFAYRGYVDELAAELAETG